MDELNEGQEQTQEPVQEPAQEQGQEPVSAPEPPASEPQGGPAIAAAGQANTYQPNYKYKVLDEEKEIDEIFRSIIKDPDTERKVKELFEKAGGLDHYKTKYSSLEQEYGNVAQEYHAIKNDINKLNEYWNTDKDLFFQALGIDQKDIYAYVKEKVKYLGLSEQEKALYDRDRDSRLRAYTLEQERQQEKEERSRYQAQARAFEVERALAKPEYSQIASAYDEIYGKGSFHNEVIQQGVLALFLQGKDISGEEAASLAYSKAKVLVDRFVSTQASGQSQEAPKKVIPTIRAGGSSPAKRRVTSIEDIRKLAAQMQE